MHCLSDGFERAAGIPATQNGLTATGASQGTSEFLDAETRWRDQLLILVKKQHFALLHLAGQ
jgi:hypothetical protein